MVPLQIKIWQPGTFVPSTCCNGAAGNSDGMKLKEMYLLLMESANQGMEAAIADNIHLSEKITKSEAYRSYGRANVDRWLLEGLLKPGLTAGNKSRIRIDRKKLEALAATSNRGTYLPVAER